MASKPNSKATASSRRTGKSLYDRLEDARNRRAEVLAHKPAANDIARRPSGVLPSDSRHFEDDPQQEPELARFPKIVMPVADEPEADVAPAKRRSKWPMVAFAGLTITAVLVLFLATPPGIGPQPIAPVEAMETPAGDTSVVALAAPINTSPQQREARRLVPLSAPVSLPRRDPVGRQPQAAVVIDASATPAVTNAPLGPRTHEGTVKKAQNTAFPLIPLSEVPITLDIPVSLRVSLNIPVQSDASDVNTVLRALEQSRHEVSAPRNVNFVVRQTQVRFFHDTDAAAATTLAKDIGGIARDFTEFSPAPPQGLVEVYVAGRDAPARPPAASRGIARDIRQLTEDIGNALRSITR